eukprot:c27637_g1_i2 orf=296-979(-)
MQLAKLSDCLLLAFCTRSPSSCLQCYLWGNEQEWTYRTTSKENRIPYNHDQHTTPLSISSFQTFLRTCLYDEQRIQIGPNAAEVKTSERQVQVQKISFRIFFILQNPPLQEETLHLYFLHLLTSFPKKEPHEIRPPLSYVINKLPRFEMQMGRKPNQRTDANIVYCQRFVGERKIHWWRTILIHRNPLRAKLSKASAATRKTPSFASTNPPPELQEAGKSTSRKAQE